MAGLKKGRRVETSAVLSFAGLNQLCDQSSHHCHGAIMTWGMGWRCLDHFPETRFSPETPGDRTTARIALRASSSKYQAQCDSDGGELSRSHFSFNLLAPSHAAL